MTLVCVYFGWWRAREHNSHVSVLLYAHRAGKVPSGTYTVVPFVLKQREWDAKMTQETFNYYVDVPLVMLVKLPYERNSRPGWPYYYVPSTERARWME